MSALKHPKISVVVPIYNAEKFIARAIASILKSDYPNFEIVIIDDLSTDEGLKIVRSKFGKNKKVKIASFTNLQKENILNFF